jgi:DNA repair protein RadA/Sms
LGTSNAELFLFDETSIDLVLNAAEKLHPDYLVIDSIQTVYTDKTDAVPGSLSQVKECTSMLTRFAKKTGVTVLLIGHITKEGLFAGPKALEHMVDVVLGFEGDRHHLYRIVRTHKNRFGSTQEIGIYKMVPEGLLPVLNPSEIFLNLTGEEASGVAVAATMEGNRPMLVETQALVTPTVFGNGQRSATGMDLRRLNMLLAVLEKKGGFKFSDKDVFLNFVGGMKTEDPSADLAVAAALVSSSHNLSINQKYVFIAEVGLTGELRPVLKPEQRIAEAEKLGFTKAFIATDSDKRTLAHKTSIEVFPCRKLTDVFSTIFG